ncbi:unnamed protein product [Rotaria socialis]|uniref:Uncharacterized protein n=1 Tax=Rotaria socialis TaxID=392032 RepID=A0A821GIW3_9BILA|nr:unnamed protein product [Rotaria socialis]
MPPKQQASKKTVEKAKAKIIEDKTFGLKNKKGTKNQKFIAQVQNQVQNAGKSAREVRYSKKRQIFISILIRLDC